MRLETETSPPNLLTRNAGKLAGAFLAGFALFLFAVLVSIRIRDARSSEWSNPIRSQSETNLPVRASDGNADSLIELPLLPSPVPFNLDLTSPRLKGRKSQMARVQEAPALPASLSQRPPTAGDVPAMPPATAAEPAPAALPVQRTVPAETTMTLALSEALSTKDNETGDRFRAVLSAPLLADGGAVAFPQGSVVTGRIVEARRAGLLGRHAVLSLEVTSISPPSGQGIALRTTQWFANGTGARLLNVPLRGKDKEEKKGSDVRLPANTKISVRLMQSVMAP